MRSQYESEMAEMRTKMEREKQTKAQMQAEVEAMKNEYENKLKALESRAKTAANRSLSRQHRYYLKKHSSGQKIVMYSGTRSPET